MLVGALLVVLAGVLAVEAVSDLPDAVGWAEDMAELAPLTVGYSKQVLNALIEPEIDPVADKELLTAFEACWTSEEQSQCSARFELCASVHVPPNV